VVVFEGDDLIFKVIFGTAFDEVFEGVFVLEVLDRELRALALALQPMTSGLGPG